MRSLGLTEIKNRVKAKVTSPKQENKPQEKLNLRVKKAKLTKKLHLSIE